VGFHVIDAAGSIEQQQQQMREIVLRELGGSLRSGVLRMSEVRKMLNREPLEFYGETAVRN